MSDCLCYQERVPELDEDFGAECYVLTYNPECLVHQDIHNELARAFECARGGTADAPA